MNQIADLLPAANIRLDLPVTSKAALFDSVGTLFAANHALSARTVVDSLVAREKLGSTGLGQGVAIPHGRIKGLAVARGAFVRLADPIDFDAPDGKPVSQIFVLLVPEQATEQHLQLLSELAQMFSDRPFRDRLGSAGDAGMVRTLFSDWKGG